MKHLIQLITTGNNVQLVITGNIASINNYTKHCFQLIIT